jgi:D-methionine transport system permease protein
MLIEAAIDTMQMVSIATVFAILLGLPTGILLEATNNHHILKNKYWWLHKVLSNCINIFNTIPVFLLLVMLMLIFNSILADHFNIELSATISLILIGSMLFAKEVFSSLSNLPNELSDTAKFLGAKPSQIVTKFLIPEAMQSIIINIASLINNLIGLAVISSALGVHGIGKLALEQGYNALELSYIFYTILLSVSIIYLIKYSGNYIANKIIINEHKNN